MTGKNQATLWVFITGVAITALTITSLAIGWKFWPWWPPEFLGETDFEGQNVSPTSVGYGGSQGTYNGVIAVSNVDRTVVSQLLPADFQLAPRRTSRTPDLHPILILFGDVTDGAWLVFPSPMYPSGLLPTGVHYSEMILAIPYVQKIDGTGVWHTYIVRMYLDNNAAVNAGNPFGYAKELAALEWTGVEAKVWKPVGGEYLESTLFWRSRWYDGDIALNKLNNFDDMVNMMTTEILGENLVCSQFEWDLDKSRVARARTSHTMKQAFKAGMTAWPGLSPFENVKYGAVVVRGLRWRFNQLTVPCRF